MAKFGKEYRKYQVKKWKESYMNYKLLKQEIKNIKTNIEQQNQSRQTEIIENNDIGHPSIKPLEIVPEDSIMLEVQDLHSLYNLRYGNELKRFIELLEKEFRKCYIHFATQEKELYKKVNVHCYSSGLYKDYTIMNISHEINEIASTLKLAKQLNCFINDNVMALKKILKKFDKKFHRYFGIISPKFILTHLTSQNSDLEYFLQFKLIDESTTICENFLNVLLNLYKRLKGNNININIHEDNKINDSNVIGNENGNNIADNRDINLNNLDDKINQLKARINDSLDSIDELTYFKIQYREWFYYAKQNERLVKNNPKIFENDIYNPVLSSTYHKDSLLEKCISSKNAFKEVERSQSPLSHSNKTNLIFILIHAAIYNKMITSIFPVISNYFDLYIQPKEEENKIKLKTLFLVPLIATYVGQMASFVFFSYVDPIDKKNFFMKITYMVSYCFIFISSILLIFVKNDASDKNKNFVLILFSRILLGFSNNQMMSKKYITLYLPKIRLPRVSKFYLLAEICGLILGPFITFFLCSINEFHINEIKYTHFNCVGWYGLFISFLAGFIHVIFFVTPMSNEFVMVKDESNISGNKYYQKSESEISRKQYLKEQNLMYRKTYNSMKKKKMENQKQNDNNKDENDVENLIIKNVSKTENTNNNELEENLIDKDNKEDKKNMSFDSGNNSLDVSTGGNITLTAKQKNMINEIEKVLEKRNEESKFNDMNQIPNTINAIISTEKKTFGYINQNLLLLFIIFFISSMIKSNLVFNYLYYIQEKLKNQKNFLQKFCGWVLCLGVGKILTLFFIFPFYQVNYKFKIFMMFSLIGLVIVNLPLIINSIYDYKYIFIIVNILLVFGSNVIEICSSCYLSFILSPEWKIFRKNVGHWTNYIIICGKICGGLLCMLLNTKDYLNHRVLLGITFVFCLVGIFLLFFTRILKIKGITHLFLQQ